MTRAAQWRPGPHDAVTDVPGVHVGHVTLDDGADIHTGVTAIVPAGICPGSPLPAGFFSGNGRGKFIGSTQVEELGELESPIVLTGTLSAFRAADALVSWMLADPRHHDVLSFNPVVGECNDGRLSDIRARPVTEAHVLHAIAAAGPGPIEQGSVGAGTGMVALGYKAGIGTAARTGELGGRPCTVGVLALANFGGRLRLAGVRPPPVVGCGWTAGSPSPRVRTTGVTTARVSWWWLPTRHLTPGSWPGSHVAPCSGWREWAVRTATRAATTRSRSPSRPRAPYLMPRCLRSSRRPWTRPRPP